MTSPGAVRRVGGGNSPGRARGAPSGRGPGRRRPTLASPALVAALVGCGGGAPLLHPAHPLPVDTVSFGAGVSGQFASSEVESAIERGQAAANGPLSDPATAQAYAEGVLLDALISPGISPWVAARVGLPGSLEAGLTYTGRSVRLDGRHVLFPWGPEWALSLGIAGSVVLLNPDSATPDAPPSGEQRAEQSLDASGWGGDIPILIGYQPLDGFVDLWFGARAGFEHISGDLRANTDDPASPRFDAEGNRYWAGALAGFSLGVPPVWLRFELAGTYHAIRGKLTTPADQPELPFGEVEAGGWSLSPSGAILGKF
ncbi:MAG TPA: hypothetical protein VNN80_19485 [Polyangiaceae bacterium]|nr:hypothetical protein [Polyangiaceae bacterium]